MFKSFFKKKNTKTEEKEQEDSPEAITEMKGIQNSSNICLINFDSSYVERLHNIGFNVSRGSLGEIVNVPNRTVFDTHNCLLNHSFPPNLHEYNVIIINMCEPYIIPYDENKHKKNHARADEQVYFNCKYPETAFDPRPIASLGLRLEIDKILDNRGALIVFAGEKTSAEYNIIKLKYDGKSSLTESLSLDTYAFSTYFPDIQNQFGTEVSVLNDINLFYELLNKHLEDLTYKVVFKPDVFWDKKLNEQQCHFVPLMKNIRKDIVSFYRTQKNGGHIFVFPQVENKLLFLEDLLTNTLPSFIPDVFPQNSTFAWIKKDDYILPNEVELKDKMEETKIEYENALLQIQEKIHKNQLEYAWLHKLLTESDYELVAVVKQYLEWLGFENVVNMDEIKPDLKEEDLQITTENGLFVIEVKGIGGTSKDYECSQVGKIVGRRMRERKSTEVHGIYIVNHQRFQEPLKRSNPPFTTKQIEDAEYDSRALLTTYQLFNLYFAIENGIISKNEAIDQFLESGLIEFIPKNCINLGKPQEIFRDGKIIILNADAHIKLNDELIIKRNEKYLKSQILEIQDNGKSVPKAVSGEFGFRLDVPVKKSDELFLRN